MKTKVFIISALLIAFVFAGCDKDKAIDTEKPVIDLSIHNAFPVNCDTIYFGESFEFKCLFTDNVELGSFSIDIHNNFDHHSHSTEVTECILGPVKEPVNPLVFIEDYDIPSGLSEYETSLSISMPSDDGNKIFDEGDYHFYISLTDHEGWSTQVGLSIKMVYR